MFAEILSKLLFWCGDKITLAQALFLTSGNQAFMDFGFQDLCDGYGYPLCDQTAQDLSENIPQTTLADVDRPSPPRSAAIALIPAHGCAADHRPARDLAVQHAAVGR
jgi:hypothetical protein